MRNNDDDQEDHFDRKSSRYRKSYMSALHELYKDVDYDSDSNRGSGTGETLFMDDVTANKIFRNS